MKKKVLLVLVLIMPIICNAKEEVKYRWYNYEESNVHYVSEPESVCEYFDKSDYKYTDYVYSLTSPEVKEGREITSDYKDYTFLRKYVNKIGITRFSGATEYDFYELEVLDKDGNSVPYEFKSYLDNYLLLKDKDYNNAARILMYVNMDIVFDSPIDIENTSIRITYKNVNGELNGIDFRAYMTDEYVSNNYAGYSTINTHVCDNEKCVFTAKIDKRQMSTTDVIVKTKVYKYRDTLYKCYDMVKNYAPGYYENLSGYKKDEEDYIVTNSLTTEEIDKIISENMNLVSEQNKELISEVMKLKSELNNKEDMLKKMAEFEKLVKSSSEDNADMLGKLASLETLIKNDNISYESVINKLSELDSKNSNFDMTELKDFITKASQKEDTTVKNVSNTNTENKETKEKIAFVTRNDESVPVKTNIFILVFGVMSFLISLVVLIKNVVKCRKK